MVGSEDLRSFENSKSPKKDSNKKERKSLTTRQKEAKQIRKKGTAVANDKSRLKAVEKIVQNERREKRIEDEGRRRDIEKLSQVKDKMRKHRKFRERDQYISPKGERLFGDDRKRPPRDRNPPPPPPE